MAACPRSFFLKGHSRKVNIHLCCHSACIQPSRPHGARSFLLCFLFFFFLFTSVLFRYVRVAPGLTSLTGVLFRWLLQATEREGSSGNCRILPGCYLQSPDTAKDRRQNAASYIEDLQRYKDLLLNRCLDGRWRALLLWRTRGNPNMWILCTARPLESRRTTTSLIWHTDCCSSTPRGEL